MRFSVKEEHFQVISAEVQNSKQTILVMQVVGLIQCQQSNETEKGVLNVVLFKYVRPVIHMRERISLKEQTNQQCHI